MTTLSQNSVWKLKNETFRFRKKRRPDDPPPQRKGPKCFCTPPPPNQISLGTASGVTLYQGTPGSKFSKTPLVEVSKARVERRICTSFLGVQGLLIRKIFESRVSEMPFPRLWGEILQNSDGQKTTL